MVSGHPSRSALSIPPITSNRISTQPATSHRWYLIVAISTHGDATRDLEFIGGDKGRQLKQVWTETRIGDILPWDEIADEAERLLESDQANRQAPDDYHVDKEQEDD